MRPFFSWRQDLVVTSIVALFCVATLLLFWPALSGPFIFDDLPNISNLSLIGGHVTRESLGSYLYSFSGSLGRPLSALSFLINDIAWPTNPRPFKYTNLLLHLINGLLIFLLILRLTADLPSKQSQIAAVATTAMWLIAPLQVASVMLTVQRMALLSAFFSLIGLVLHVRSIQASRTLPPLRALFILARLALFTLLAFLCKENGALVPLFAVCVHATLLRRRLQEIPPRSRMLLIYGAAAPWVLIVLYFLTNPSYVTGGYGAGREFTLGQRVMTETRVLWSYLGNIALPKIGGHSVFHDDYVLSKSILEPITTLVSAACWIVTATLALAKRNSAPWFAFAVLWFLAGHAMESTVISLEIYFEHRNYLAMLGPMLFFGVWLGQCKFRFAAPLLAMWLTFAGISTFSNAKVWSSKAGMAAIWFAEHPHSVRAIQLKASALAEAGDVNGAIAALDQGYKQLPAKGELLFQTLPLRCATGLMSRKLLPEYLAAAGTVSTPQIPASQLGDLRKVAKDCVGFGPADWWKLTDTLLANPRMRVSNNALAHIHYQRAQAAVTVRDLNRAMDELDLSYAAEPNPFIAREQALYLLSAGLFEDSLRYLDKSDSTPVSFWKQWTFDAKSMNAALRTAIKKRLHVPNSSSKQD